MAIINYLSPTNLAQEKARFFASSTYNPVLSYQWETDEARTWVAAHPEYAELAFALKTQDSALMVQAASRVFDTAVDPTLLDTARAALSQAPEYLQAQPISKIVADFESAFRFLGLNEYRVEVLDQHGFNFRPVSAEKKICMSKYLNLDFFSVDGEIKHELVHILRYENGVANQIAIEPNYLPTEEGLATFYQDYMGEAGPASLFQHAAEYSVTDVALHGSLRDMTDYLQDIGFSAELAWQRGIRHKYGWINTAQPGDIMKPSMYFYHEQKIRTLTQDERLRLFVGKIPLSQLPEYPVYSGRVSLERLAEFYQPFPSAA